MAPVSKSRPLSRTAGDAPRTNPPTALDPARRPRRTESHADDQTVDGMLFVPIRPGFRGAA